MPLGLPVDYDELAAICRRYRVARLELFGSRARGEARSDSDVDLLVTFEEGFTPGWELGGLHVELTELFGCKVDLVTRWVIDHDDTEFKQAVESEVERLYAA